MFLYITIVLNCFDNGFNVSFLLTIIYTYIYIFDCQRVIRVHDQGTKWGYDTGIPLGSQMHEIFFLRFYYDFDTVGRYEFDRLSIWGYDFVTILLRFRYGSGYGLDTILIRF